MNQCKKCLCLGPDMKSDVEVIGSPIKDGATCLAYPDGIPEKFLTDQAVCVFRVDD